MLVKLQMHTKLHEEIRVKCLTLLKTSMSQQTLVKYWTSYTSTKCTHKWKDSNFCRCSAGLWMCIQTDHKF